MKKSHLTYQHHIASFFQYFTLYTGALEVIIIHPVGALFSLVATVPTFFEICGFKDFLPPMVIYHEIEILQYQAPDKKLVVVPVRVGRKGVGNEDKCVIACQLHHINGNGGNLTALERIGNPDRVCGGAQRPSLCCRDIRCLQ